VPLEAGEGLFIPVGVRHRLENTDARQPAFAVFHLGPLAPRPDLGHVDTEPAPSAAAEAR
jgi:putative monooxygenase